MFSISLFFSLSLSLSFPLSFSGRGESETIHLAWGIGSERPTGLPANHFTLTYKIMYSHFGVKGLAGRLMAPSKQAERERERDWFRNSHKSPSKTTSH